jgi:cytochrome c-type biogenesis protein CcmH
MILWTILAALAVMAALGLAFAFIRFLDIGHSGPDVTETLKAQMAVIDAQVSTGAIGAAEADASRVEVMRRLLNDESPAAPRLNLLSKRVVLGIAVGLVAAVALAALALYAKVSPSAAPTMTQAPGGVHPGGGDIGQMIGQLEAKLKQSPNDAQGWGMLGWSYFQTGRFADAADAYGRAAALDPNDAESLSAQGESRVRASGSRVTPAALEAFHKAAAVDPGDPRARYFLAVAKDQQGDHKGAMDDWIALIRTAPEGAPWATEVRAFVEGEARKHGEDISARLPPAAAGGAAAASTSMAQGPDAAQVAAASGMSEPDRQRMIAGMVDGLEARLKSNPKDVDGWISLMRARMVLGQTARAQTALHDASKAFAGSADDLARLRQAARTLTVPGN